MIRPVETHAEYLAALRVRTAVFVEEQGGAAEDEPDEWDTCAQHFVVLDGGCVVGTGRLYHPARDVAKIGRVALLAPYRGRGWGVLLMEKLMAHARALGFPDAILDSQTHACPFYERFGFAPEGEEFLDAGIPHRRMRLRL